MSLDLWFRDPWNYHRVQRKLHQFFYSRGCHEAEDLTQKTYLHILTLEKEGKVVVRSDWIFLVVARFMWLKQCREQVWEPLELPDGSVREVPGPDDVRLIRLLILAEQLAAVTKLSEKDKRILELSLEREVEEIAEIFGMTPEAVRVRLAQIRKRLRVADRRLHKSRGAP